MAIAARLSIGALLLSAGPAQFVLASDDGDAYDAVARAQALGTPIVMTDRLVGKWPDAGDVAARWPQGYTWFLAAQYRLFGSAYVSTIVLQALLGAGGVLAAFALASRLLPESAARLAGVGQALSSTGLYLSAGLFAESVYVPLLLGGLALLVRRESERRSRWLWPALAGTLFGLAEVTRPLGLAVFAAAWLWTICQRAAAGCAWPVSRVRRSGGSLRGPRSGHVGPPAAADRRRRRRPARRRSAEPERCRARADAVHHRRLGAAGRPAGRQFGRPDAARPAGRVGLALGGVIWLLAPVRRTPETWLLVAAALAVVGPALLLGLPLVRYRAPADPLFIICMVAGVLGACQAAWSATALRRGLAG